MYLPLSKSADIPRITYVCAAQLIKPAAQPSKSLLSAKPFGWSYHWSSSRERGSYGTSYAESSVAPQIKHCRWLISRIHCVFNACLAPEFCNDLDRQRRPRLARNTHPAAQPSTRTTVSRSCTAPLCGRICIPLRVCPFNPNCSPVG